MPNVNILCEQLLPEQKKTLVRQFTDIFTQEHSCPADAVTLRFIELSQDQYAVAGRLHSAFHHYPQITPPVISEINVSWYAGTPENMADKIAERLTKAVTETLGVNASTVEINFQELHRGNHFEGGKRVDIPQP